MFEQIVTLYETLLLRTPSQVEVESWLALGYDIEQVRSGIVNSAERHATVTVVTANGKEYSVAVDATDNSFVRNHTEHSLADWHVLLSQIKSGDVVVDLGAHRGAFAVQAAARGAKVLAIEAGTLNAELLRRTVRLNPTLDIQVHHCAAWHQKEVLGFAENSAWGMVGTQTDVQVPAERVDDVVGELLDRVICIKMDIEGVEPNAVRGMPKLLERDIDVFYETNSHTLNLFGYTTQELHKQFADAGFTNYLLHDGKFHVLVAGDTQPTTVADCFATRRDLRRLGVVVAPRIPDAEMSVQMLKYLSYPESRKHVLREIAKRPALLTRKLAAVLGTS